MPCYTFACAKHRRRTLNGGFRANVVSTRCWDWAMWSAAARAESTGVAEDLEAVIEHPVRVSQPCGLPEQADQQNGGAREPSAASDQQPQGVPRSSPTSA